MINLYTIGFTKKSAQEFFTKLKEAKIKRLIDIRLNNVSQLAGFAKRNDLKYFLKELCECDYIHEPKLAPTKEILDGYKKNKISWIEYEEKFIKLLNERNADLVLSADDINNSCLLCSENTPDNCHRRLVAEFYKSRNNDINIVHL